MFAGDPVGRERKEAEREWKRAEREWKQAERDRRAEYIRRASYRISDALYRFGPLTEREIRELTHVTIATFADALPMLIENGDVRPREDGRYEDAVVTF